MNRNLFDKSLIEAARCYDTFFLDIGAPASMFKVLMPQKETINVVYFDSGTQILRDSSDIQDTWHQELEYSLEKALEVDISYGAGRTVERDIIYDRLSTLRRL